jgi:hypothetical protein
MHHIPRSLEASAAGVQGKCSKRYLLSSRGGSSGGRPPACIPVNAHACL